MWPPADRTCCECGSAFGALLRARPATTDLIDRWLEDPAATFADILRAVVPRGDQTGDSFSTGSHAQRLTSNGSIE